MICTTTLKVTSKIEDLIPQRSPIIMVDELLDVKGDECTCRLTVRKDNFFLEQDGMIAEPGIIEHIAQSASAFAGYKAICDGATEPPVGYIAEIKNFKLYRRPCLSDDLLTTITMGATVGGVTIINGVTRCGDEILADTQMKIFIKE